MIEVSMTLEDADELEIFNEFVKTIERWRGREEQAGFHSRVADLPDAPSVPLAQVIEESAQDAAPKIDAGMMEAAITAYYKAYGLAAAKELLGKYGVERVTQIAPERQAEAYAELTT